MEQWEQDINNGAPNRYGSFNMMDEADGSLWVIVTLIGSVLLFGLLLGISEAVK